MTEDQVAKWQKRRDEAKKIADPVAREHALDVVYDLKDDMQLDCQRKMADRIKELKASDDRQTVEMASLKQSVVNIEVSVKQQAEAFKEDHEIVQEVREHKLRAHGVMLALKWLGYILAAGGGSAVTYFLSVINKAGGVQ